MSDIRDSSTWRLQTAGGIPYRVLDFGGAFGTEEATASAKYLIRASDLLEIVQEWLPESREVDGGNVILFGGATFPGLPALRADSIKWSAFVPGLPVDPFGSDTGDYGDGTYGELIQLDVDYKTSKQNNENDNPNDPITFLEISGQASGSFLNVVGARNEIRREAEAGDRMSDDNGNPLPNINWNTVAPVVISVPEVEWTVKWPRVPWSRFNGTIIHRLRDAQGKVNDADFGPLFNAPTGTLLFTGFNYSETYTWRSFEIPVPGRDIIPGVGRGRVDMPPVTIEMKFQEKYIKDEQGQIRGHNYAFVPGLGWRETFIGEGAQRKPMYRSTSYAALFAPPDPPAQA